MMHRNSPNDQNNSNSDQTENVSSNEASHVIENRRDFYAHTLSTIFTHLRWKPTSHSDLEQAETDLLSTLTRSFRKYFVDIGSGWGKQSNRVRTIEMLTDDEIQGNQPSSKRCPLVLVHGFGAGIGSWILNLDDLVRMTNRKIYAFDVIGFARSSRAPFDLSSTDAIEEQFVDSIEKWRKEQKIDKFIILGHSFGGYLSACYVLKHPNRIAHLILEDPWGVMEKPDIQTYRLPFWFRTLSPIFAAFNPLAILRVSGPGGPALVHRFRGDLREKFRPKLGDNCHRFLDYIYHCNARKATGETAFKALALPFGWPKNPMIHRLVDVDESIKMTFIYGARSWIETTPAIMLRDCLAPGRIVVNTIQRSGHHVHADQPDEFNELVRDACATID